MRSQGLRSVSVFLIFLFLLAPFLGCRSANDSEARAILYPDEGGVIEADLGFCNADDIREDVADSFTSFLFYRSQSDALEDRILVYADSIQRYGIEVMVAKLAAIRMPLKLDLSSGSIDGVVPQGCLNLENYQVARQQVIEKWNSAALQLPYPSTLQSQCTDGASASTRFEDEFAAPISAELANLCQANPNSTRFFKRPTGMAVDDLDTRQDDDYQIMDYALNATVAGGYFNAHAEDRDSKIAFCALLNSEEVSKSRVKTFDALEPWIAAGAGVSIGILGSVLGSAAGAMAADLALTTVLVAKHMIRLQLAHDAITALEARAVTGISDRCRADALQAHAVFLNDLIFWDVVGSIIGYGVGAALPGIGKMLAAAFKNGKAFIENGVVLIPSLDFAAAIPAPLIITFIANKLPANAASLFEPIIAKYDSLFSGRHSVPGVEVDAVPSSLNRQATRIATAPQKELFDHETNRYFRMFQPRNLDDVTRANEAWVAEAEKIDGLLGALDSSISRAVTDIDDALRKPFSEFLETARRLAKELHENAAKAAESFSGRHQTDMLAVRDSPLWRRMTALGINGKAFINGVLDSDKGKLSLYKALFTTSSAKSDLLLNTIRGIDNGTNAAAVRLLREFLDDNGYAGKWLLNPDEAISNDAMRDVFANTPVLIGWLHDLPGFADSVELLATGALNEETFKQIMSTNLFHNGPAKGFWGFLTENLVPDALSKSADTLGEGARNFFKGTVYAAEEIGDDGVIREVVNAAGVVMTKYPIPKNFDGLAHLILDRLSQATRGGGVKIWFEVAAFTKPAAIINDVIIGGARGTMAQYDEVLAHIETVAANGAAPGKGGLSSLQADELKQLATIAKARIQQYSEAAAAAFKIDEGRITVNFIDAGGEQVNHVFSSSASHEEVFPYVLRFLMTEEAAHGDPFKVLVGL